MTMTAPATETAPEVRERTASDVLLAAARIIEERGWCQNTYEDPGGHLCALGALNIASGGPAWTANLSDRNREARYRLMEFTVDSIDLWNDTPGRTEAEVIAALRAAAS